MRICTCLRVFAYLRACIGVRECVCAMYYLYVSVIYLGCTIIMLESDL